MPFGLKDAGSSNDDSAAINKDLEEKLATLKTSVKKNEKEVRDRKRRASHLPLRVQAALVLFLPFGARRSTPTRPRDPARPFPRSLTRSSTLCATLSSKCTRTLSSPRPKFFPRAVTRRPVLPVSVIE